MLIIYTNKDGEYAEHGWHIGNKLSVNLEDVIEIVADNEEVKLVELYSGIHNTNDNVLGVSKHFKRLRCYGDIARTVVANIIR